MITQAVTHLSGTWQPRPTIYFSTNPFERLLSIFHFGPKSSLFFLPMSWHAADTVKHGLLMLLAGCLYSSSCQIIQQRSTYISLDYSLSPVWWWNTVHVKSLKNGLYLGENIWRLFLWAVACAHGYTVTSHLSLHPSSCCGNIKFSLKVMTVSMKIGSVDVTWNLIGRVMELFLDMF